jgi:lipoprotein-anchoring transpeptidase ErfK/SrfK
VILTMRVITSCLLAAFATLATAAATTVASADVTAKISLDDQVMKVYIDNKLAHSWEVSSGRGGHNTPTGNYRPTRLSIDHRSSQYDDAPMPHSVFFRGGYAIHGTDATRALGNRASHGCIRLSRGNARKFYSLVENHGFGSTRIVIN